MIGTKECPLKIECCENCRWNFGHDKCAFFSIAADFSVLSEELPKIRMALEYLCKREQG